MARPRYALARQEADKLLARFGATTPEQIDVRRIAEELCGAKVVYEPFRNDGLSGALIREQGSAPLIGVNASHKLPRQRFTIAHELGHLLMHDESVHVDKQIHLRDKTSSTADSILEVEANQFAANLLMPAWMLEKDLNEHDVIDMEDTIKELADRYRVSVQAMTLRVSKLQKYGL